MLALAHSGSLDLPFLIPFGLFFPVVRLVDEVLGGDSSYSRCRFPVRRNLDFYAEISEATVKNDNKQQKNNSYDKDKVSKNKVNPD